MFLESENQMQLLVIIDVSVVTIVNYTRQSESHTGSSLHIHTCVDI